MRRIIICYEINKIKDRLNIVTIFKWSDSVIILLPNFVIIA